MPFCHNPECPHKKRTGSPAEFQHGIIQCPDCGSSLADTEPVEPEAKPPLLTRDLIKRFVFTVAVLVLYRLLLLIPAPGVNPTQLDSADVRRIFLAVWPKFSILTLGIVPYIGAYVWVEIWSVIIPPLKSWRAEGTQGRRRLLKTALLTTVVFASLQGYLLAGNLENMAPLGLTPLVPNPGWSFRLLFMLSLTGGTFLLLWMAHLITMRGIGHGISIMILVSYSPAFLSLLSSVFQLSEKFPERERFEVFLLSVLAILLIAVVVSIIVIVERRHREVSVKFSDGTEATFSIKMTTAGTPPATIGASLAVLPLTLASFFEWSHLTQFYSYGSLSYYVLYALITIFLYFLFTALFHNPSAMIDHLRKNNASIVLDAEKDVSRFLDRKLELMAALGASYIVVLTIVCRLGVTLLGISVGAIVLITMVVIVLDVSYEARFRKTHEALSNVAEFHNLARASLLRSVLKSKGIPCLLRGYYHRGILYFFGPYIEISALVPRERAQEAAETISSYGLAQIL
jgi:preprotein translocase subunit SecY